MVLRVPGMWRRPTSGAALAAAAEAMACAEAAREAAARAEAVLRDLCLRLDRARDSNNALSRARAGGVSAAGNEEVAVVSDDDESEDDEMEVDESGDVEMEVGGADDFDFDDLEVDESEEAAAAEIARIVGRDSLSRIYIRVLKWHLQTVALYFQVVEVVSQWCRDHHAVVSRYAASKRTTGDPLAIALSLLGATLGDGDSAERRWASRFGLEKRYRDGDLPPFAGLLLHVGETTLWEKVSRATGPQKNAAVRLLAGLELETRDRSILALALGGLFLGVLDLGLVYGSLRWYGPRLAFVLAEDSVRSDAPYADALPVKELKAADAELKATLAQGDASAGAAAASAAAAAAASSSSSSPPRFRATSPDSVLPSWPGIVAGVANVAGKEGNLKHLRTLSPSAAFGVTELKGAAPRCIGRHAVMSERTVGGTGSHACLILSAAAPGLCAGSPFLVVDPETGEMRFCGNDGNVASMLVVPDAAVADDENAARGAVLANTAAFFASSIYLPHFKGENQRGRRKHVLRSTLSPLSDVVVAAREGGADLIAVVGGDANEEKRVLKKMLDELYNEGVLLDGDARCALEVNYAGAPSYNHPGNGAGRDIDAMLFGFWPAGKFDEAATRSLVKKLDDGEDGRGLLQTPRYCGGDHHGLLLPLPFEDLGKQSPALANMLSSMVRTAAEANRLTSKPKKGNWDDVKTAWEAVVSGVTQVLGWIARAAVYRENSKYSKEAQELEARVKKAGGAGGAGGAPQE